MNLFGQRGVLTLVLLSWLSIHAASAHCQVSEPIVEQNTERNSDLAISIAVLPFEGEESPQVDQLITGLLTAQLSQRENWLVLERRRMDAILEEMDLNISGLVKQDAAIRLGELVGARVLVTGSILKVGDSRYIIAKLIGTETSRVSGVSVKAEIDSPVSDQVEKLTDLIAREAEAKLEKLVATGQKEKLSIAKLRKLVKKLNRKRTAYSVAISVDHQSVNGKTVDSAIQNELKRVLTEIGLPIVDQEDADLQIRASGISDFGIRKGNLISVSGRVEMELLKAGKVIAANQESKIVFGTSEAIAGKDALQLATASLAVDLISQVLEAQK